MQALARQCGDFTFSNNNCTLITSPDHSLTPLFNTAAMVMVVVSDDEIRVSGYQS
jgi:hypothetical protein